MQASYQLPGGPISAYFTVMDTICSRWRINSGIQENIKLTPIAWLKISTPTTNTLSELYPLFAERRYCH